uniref:Uncharacterized protein n=1 Tax=Solanum tuberosum TaxID=4113 RepID=M1DZY3_SOLTU
MSCHKLNEQNEGDENEFEEHDEEIMIFEHFVEDLKQFENSNKSNLDETETVNLEKDDCVKVVRVRVHLRKDPKRELNCSLGKYIDAFVGSHVVVEHRHSSQDSNQRICHQEL